MRYILTLFLIALASSSQIINKDDEIKEFDEYGDVELQYLLKINVIIPIIEKVCIVGIALCDKVNALKISAKYFKNINRTKGISEIIKDNTKFIKKPNTPPQKVQILSEEKKIFEKGLRFCKKYRGLINNSRIDKKVSTIDKVKQNEIYQTYQKIKVTYNNCREIYEKVKEDYEQSKTFYYNYLKKRITPEEQQELEKNRIQRTQAFQRYGQLRNNNTMTLSEKQVEINNHLNYMLNNGFITPAQKQQMSNIKPPVQIKIKVNN